MTISPSFQVIIPKDIGDQLSLAPGQKVHAIGYKDPIELIPVCPLRQMRCYVRGIETDVPREKDEI